MTNAKEFHCHMRMNLQPYEENRIFLRPSMAQERMYNLVLLNTEQDIVHKMDFTDIIDLFTAAKVFCSKDLQFWISFSSTSLPKIILLSVQFEKYPFPNFCDFSIFKSHNMNTKLKFQVGPGAPNFFGAPGPIWS